MTRRKSAGRAAPLLLALLGSSPLAAATVGTGTQASCSEAALDAAIATAGASAGTVDFDCGLAPYTIRVTSEKLLANGVTIDGGGKITLFAGNATRILRVAESAVVIVRDITLRQGSASQGGCLLSQSSASAPAQVFISGVIFDGCRASSHGGAIAAMGTSLPIVDSVFRDNESAAGSGGAISLESGILPMQRVRFDGNSALDQGGAVRVVSSTLQIYASDFEDNRTRINTAGASGGAVHVEDSSGELGDGTFFANSSLGGAGGAVRLAGNSQLELDDNRFDANQAATGGALHADAAARPIVRRSTFHGNQAGQQGGAILAGGDIYVHASTFSGNRSHSQGGAVHIPSGGFLDLVSATFYDNYNIDAPASTGQLSWASGAVMNVHNTLLQAGANAAPACAGPGGVFSFSLWNGDSCPFVSGLGNLRQVVLPLQPLGFACGAGPLERTATHALPPGSPAIDTGSCRPSDPAFDQRGLPRPQGAACDIGAAEFYEPCDAPSFFDGFENGNTQRWSVTLP